MATKNSEFAIEQQTTEENNKTQYEQTKDMRQDSEKDIRWYKEEFLGKSKSIILAERMQGNSHGILVRRSEAIKYRCLALRGRCSGSCPGNEYSQT